MVTGAPVILFALDRRGTITLSEGAALEALGIEPGSTVGQSVFELNSDQPAMLACIRRALAGETVVATLTVQDVTFDVRYTPQFDQHGDVDQVVGVATDITAQEQAETELHQWVAFDRLVHRIFTQFIEIAPDASVTPEEFDATILQALGEIGRFSEAARGFILEKTDVGDILSETYEWRADGVEQAKGGVRAIPVESVPWMMEQVDKGTMLYVPTIEELPPQVRAQIVGFGCEGLRGMVAMPMTSRGRVVGVVGFEWTDSPTEVEIQAEIRQMAVVQSLFANALQQRRIGGDLQNKNRLLPRRARVQRCPDPSPRCGRAPGGRLSDRRRGRGLRSGLGGIRPGGRQSVDHPGRPMGLRRGLSGEPEDHMGRHRPRARTDVEGDSDPGSSRCREHRD